MLITGSYINFGSLELTQKELGDRYGVVEAQRVAMASGIDTIRICGPNQDSFDLAQELIKLNNLEGDLEACDLIIVVSEHTKNIIPPPSSFILKKCNTEQALVLDLNRGCSGFVEALLIVKTFFDSQKRVNNFVKAAIICADNYSRYSKQKNRTVSSIFGDAASAIFLERGEEMDWYSSFGTFASASDNLRYFGPDDGIRMNGTEVARFVRTSVLPSVRKLIEDAPITPDVFLVHQGSKLIVDEFKNHFKLQEERCPFVISKTGNVNSSSIPFIIDSMGKTLSDRWCLLSGFGVGLSFANLLARFKVASVER